MEVKFPKDFVWGVATSAAQVEGAAMLDGRGLSIWDVFSRIPGAIENGDTPDVACDHYHLYKDDIKLMKELGVRSYRFSVSWSRILPEGRGAVNEKGLDFYKRLIDELLKNGITPNMTLYHWDLPYELENYGGWLNRDTAKWFGEYARLIFKEFGDRVPLFSTVNEPIATYVGYAQGVFAPGKKLPRYGRQACHNLLLAHGEGVKAFRAAALAQSKIGIVVDIWHRHPADPDSEGDVSLARKENEESYLSFLNPIFKGSYSDYLIKDLEDTGCMPEIKDGDMRLISQPIDFFGLNCYNRVVVSSTKTDIKEEIKKRGGNFLESGQEFYPKCIYDALKMLHNDFGIRIPIYITENGTFGKNERVSDDGVVHDTERIKYIGGFLRYLRQAMDEGIDVRGYYLWSLLDNFEWSAGYSMQYGICRTDFATQKRTMKESAYWYRDVIRSNGFVSEK